MGAQRKSSAWVIIKKKTKQNKKKNLLRKVFLELIKIGIESWLYYFCDTNSNSLNLSYLALMSLTKLL